MSARKHIKRLVRCLRSEDGPTAVEYAVMLAMIMLVCVGAVKTLATATGSSFANSSQAISQAISGS